MDMSKYRGMFLSETRDHLKSMSRQVVALEQDPSNREGIDALFRNAHSIKGMAASMGYDHCARLAHHLEDLMDGFRQSGSVPSQAVDRLLGGVDLLEKLLEDIEAHRPERAIDAYMDATAEGTAGVPLPDSGQAVPASAGGRVLQVRIDLSPETAAPSARAILVFRELATMGEVTNQSPEPRDLRAGARSYSLTALLESAMAAEDINSALSSLPDVARVEVSRQSRAPAPRTESGGSTIRVRTELLDQLINITGELLNNRYTLQDAFNRQEWSSLKQGLGHLARMVTDLHHHVLGVRMLPLENITAQLPRQVRDLARKSGKRVDLKLGGEEIELDRTILEELADPLIHMVRNAVDHGIAEEGTVRVRAWREKDLAMLEVADDGAGMDPDGIRQKAVEKGLITDHQARTLPDRDILQIVCMPGFSTAGSITETSGRGVGMDVVKNAVEKLGGTLQIDSARGEGTRILLKLPLSVAILRILLVEVDAKVVAIPINRVLRTVELEQRQIKSSGKQLVFRYEEEVIPLLSLRRILKLPSRKTSGSLPVILSEFRGRKVGLVVDQLLGQRESFVKSLSFPLEAMPGLSGATFLGDGQIVFVIDPQSLIEETLFGPRGPGAAP